ncbi:MAG: replication initiation protein, partial [Campylobacterota bacterium]|nr:replication initiation protein [Campylobacterota bacterium]
MILKKYSILTQAKSDLGLVDRKVLNFLLYIKQTQNTQNYTYITSIKEIKTYLDTKHNNQAIIKAFDNLTTKIIMPNILQKEKNTYEPLCILKDYKRNSDHSIEFRFSNTIQNLSTANNLYSNLDLKTTITFKSKYTLTLYELINDYQRVKLPPNILIDTLQNILGSNYKNYTLFKNKTLKTATLEIQNKTTYGLKAMPKKAGTSYKFITIIFKDITKDKRFLAFKKYMLKHHNNLPIKTKIKTVIISKKLTSMQWKIIFINMKYLEN